MALPSSVVAAIRRMMLLPRRLPDARVTLASSDSRGRAGSVDVTGHHHALAVHELFVTIGRRWHEFDAAEAYLAHDPEQRLEARHEADTGRARFRAVRVVGFVDDAERALEWAHEA